MSGRTGVGVQYGVKMASGESGTRKTVLENSCVPEF